MPDNPIDREEMDETLDMKMRKDPRLLTDEDFLLIYQEMRAGRHTWITEEANAKRAGRRPKLSAGQKEAKNILDEKMQSEIADLNLDLDSAIADLTKG